MADQTTFAIDIDDPRAPPMEVWERLTPEQRRRVVDMLPADVPYELYPPEGDLHREAKNGPLDALRVGRLRFLFSSAELPESVELIARLGAMVDDLVAKHAKAAKEAEEQRLRAERAEQLLEQERQTAAARIAELEAELERLRRG